MNKAHLSSHSIYSYLFSGYIYKLLTLMGSIVLLLVSNVSFALTTIPNQCPSGQTLGSLTKADYENILSNYPLNSTASPITGNNALNIKMTKVDSASSTVVTDFKTTTTIAGDSALNVIHTLNDTVRPPAAYGDIKLSFTKNGTNDQVYLTNVALSAFDIDRTVATTTTNPTTGLPYSNFDDAIIVTGESQSGPIDGIFQQALGGSVIELSAGRFRISDITKNCANQNLDALCQASFKFAQPVSSVTVRYINSDRLRPKDKSSNNIIDPTTGQQIDIRLDSYCYTPPSIFTGRVFNDNGGIAALETTKQDISNTFTGNPNYFNGILDSSELGIYDSALKVSLTDCSVSNTLISTTSPNPQTVSNVPTTLGQYKFDVAADALTNKTKVCLVESEPISWIGNDGYSVDTTTNKIEVPLLTNTYAYNKLNFGEVNAYNTALVLKKSQYVHTCNSQLNYDSIPKETPNPTTGFSNQPISGVTPNQCIAYRIIAYNRGHIDLRDVQIKDPLQSVKSSFSQPLPKGNPINIYTNVGSEPPTINFITSNLFNLAKASGEATIATLYFNTRYNAINN